MCAAYMVKVCRCGVFLCLFRLQFGLPADQGLLFHEGKPSGGGGKEFIRWTMDANRHVKRLQTVPGHLAPTLTDVAKSEKSLRHPPIEANLPVQWVREEDV